MGLQSDLRYKVLIFGVIGAALGFLLAHREVALLPQAVIEGYILGAVVGSFLVAIGHFYRNYFRSKPMAGAIILGIFGAAIGGIIGYSVELEQTRKVPGQPYLILLARDIGLGGVSGGIIGLLAGSVDKARITRREAESENSETSSKEQTSKERGLCPK